MKFILLTICLTFLMSQTVHSAKIPGLKGPLHAQCKINWVWPSNSCKEVHSRIVAQINDWTSADNCKNGGEKCLYKLVSDSETVLKATHTTPVKKYVDDLTFTFKDSQTKCEVEGFSTSETWYAVLDYGTNYCNLHNLITGSGLDKENGYTEVTSDDVCTQYSSANCEIY